MQPWSQEDSLVGSTRLRSSIVLVKLDHFLEHSRKTYITLKPPNTVECRLARVVVEAPIWKLYTSQIGSFLQTFEVTTNQIALKSAKHNISSFPTKQLWILKKHPFSPCLQQKCWNSTWPNLLQSWWIGRVDMFKVRSLSVDTSQKKGPPTLRQTQM